MLKNSPKLIQTGLFFNFHTSLVKRTPSRLYSSRNFSIFSGAGPHYQFKSGVSLIQYNKTIPKIEVFFFKFIVIIINESIYFNLSALRIHLGRESLLQERENHRI
jgi:hypothetical protein